MKSNRRQFIMISAASVAGLATAKVAYAQPMVAETEPQAAALGYKSHTKDVDGAKFPKHKPDQLCSNCALYTAKTPEAGPCSVFPGKLVAADGWCNLWVRKPG